MCRADPDPEPISPEDAVRICRAGTPEQCSFYTSGGCLGQDPYIAEVVSNPERVNCDKAVIQTVGS